MLTPLLTKWRPSLASRIKCTFGPLDDFYPFLLWRKGEEFCKHCHCRYKCLMLNVLSCLFKLYCEINEPHIILNLNSTIQLMNVEWEKYILMRTEHSQVSPFGVTSSRRPNSINPQNISGDTRDPAPAPLLAWEHGGRSLIAWLHKLNIFVFCVHCIM